MKNRARCKKRGNAILWGAFSMLLILQPAWADKFQASFFGGINHTFGYGAEDDYVPGENDFPVTPAHTPAVLGASFALYLTDNASLELDGRFTLSSNLTLMDPSDGDTVAIGSSKHYSVTLNFLYRFLEGNVRPYLAFGGGIDKLLAEDSAYLTEYGYEVEFLAPENTVDPVANLGGGVYLFLNPNIGIRFDFRYVTIFSERDTTTSLNGVVGIFVLF
jgi:outer membrane protein W